MVPSLSTAAGLRDIVTNTGFAMLTAAVFGATGNGSNGRASPGCSSVRR
jgi:hypothetical protein